MDALQVAGGSGAHPVLVASTEAVVVAPVITPEIAPTPGQSVSGPGTQLEATKFGGRGEA
jgi:hypothetical protein